MREVWSHVSKASAEATEGMTKAAAKLASSKKNRGGGGSNGSLPFDENRVVLKTNDIVGGGGGGGGGLNRWVPFVGGNVVGRYDCLSSSVLICFLLSMVFEPMSFSV